MSDPRHYKRGDVVWSEQVESYHRILAEPSLRRGVVTGAGEYRIHVTWDGRVGHEQYSQGAGFHDTRLEALQAAQWSLKVIRQDAMQRADQALTALVVCEEMIAGEKAAQEVADEPAHS